MTESRCRGSQPEKSLLTYIYICYIVTYVYIHIYVYLHIIYTNIFDSFGWIRAGEINIKHVLGQVQVKQKMHR